MVIGVISTFTVTAIGVILYPYGLLIHVCESLSGASGLVFTPPSNHPLVTGLRDAGLPFIRQVRHPLKSVCLAQRSRTLVWAALMIRHNKVLNIT